MSTPRLLIVEDESIISRDIAQQLRHFGYEVVGQLSARGIGQTTCVGIGKCEEIAEDAVELGDDGVSHVTGVAVDEDVARNLCDSCPTGAISLVED